MILDAGGLGVLQRRDPKLGDSKKKRKEPLKHPVFGGLLFPLQHFTASSPNFKLVFWVHGSFYCIFMLFPWIIFVGST